MTRPLFLLTILVCVWFPTIRGEAEDFVPLFNGRDLQGWVPVNVAPGTFSVRDGMIVSTGVPTGVLRTTKQYENFVLELEWRHMQPGGNAGLFVWSDPLTAPGTPFCRSIEVQILDGRDSDTYTSHGDVFAIHGAVMTPDRPHPKGAMRCLPSERRAKSSPEWNHYRVECNNGTLKLAVNGKVVSGGTNCKPRKGYLCLESEGSEAHFRNLRIQGLPSTNPASDEIAPAAFEWHNLYNGLDLTHWKSFEGHTGHWRTKDWILDYDGQSTADDKNLWSDREFGDFVLVCDWRLTKSPEKMNKPRILPNGEDGADEELMDAGDSGIYLRGNSKNQVNIWSRNCGSGEVHGYRVDRSLPAEIRAGATPKKNADHPPGQWNRFLITMKGEQLTVVLNGETVIDQAKLPGIAARGPIALQHHGDPIQFANLLIRELP